MTTDGGNGTPLSAHPAAEVMPEMSPTDYAGLLEAIRERGLDDPIIVHPDGGILDGRHRYRACVELGITPDIQLWDGERGHELDYVLDHNLARRHLTESQRALVAARVRDFGGGPARGKKAAAAADRLNVSTRSVENAAKVLREGAPELVAAVERGEAKVRPAASIASLPPEEQALLVARGPEEIIAMARQLEGRRGRTPGVLHSSKSSEYPTPEEFWPAILAALGVELVDLDPAAEPAKRFPARRHLTAEDDAFTKEWSAETIYLNPAWGERAAPRWAEKFRAELDAGRVRRAVCSLPGRIETRWLQDVIRPEIMCMVTGRVTYVGQEDPAGFPTIFTGHGIDLDTFSAAFARHGQIWVPYTTTKPAQLELDEPRGAMWGSKAASAVHWGPKKKEKARAPYGCPNAYLTPKQLHTERRDEVTCVWCAAHLRDVHYCRGNVTMCGIDPHGCTTTGEWTYVRCDECRQKMPKPPKAKKTTKKAAKAKKGAR